MNRIVRFALGAILLVGLVANHPARGAAKGCGGEGPTPLHDISHQLFPKLEWIESRAGVQDFIFWDIHNTLVFRTPADLLRRYSLDSGFSTSMTRMDRPLAQLADASERYVVMEGVNSVYDTNDSTWKQFTGPTQPLLHLFWNNHASDGEQLYTLSQRQSGSAQVFSIHRYTPQSDRSEHLCSFTPQAKGAKFKVARGFYYPYVLFWAVERNFFGKQTLYTYRMNVEKDCTFQTEAVNVDDYPGTIQDVYQFRDIETLGVKMNHARLAFMYKYGSECKCFDTANLAPVVLDADKGLLATWMPGRGLKLMDLSKLTQGWVWETQHWAVTDLAQKDVWYSARRGKLFLSPLFQGEMHRRLVQIELAGNR